MQMRINEAVSGIDIQLQKRRDTLTKMVDAASSSAKFEKGLLEEVTKMRQTKNFDQTTTEGQQNKSTLDRLFAQVEAYPNVKSVQAFVELMDAADYQEREIAATRRIYNSLATEFNQQLFVFYGNVIATKKHLYTYPMFAASDEAKKDVSLKISV
jgi:LemA protein